MTAPLQCRLLRHGPADGAWNMAVDEVLLERAAGSGAACWRFYAWSEPTLSLGYFQTYDDRKEHPPSMPCSAIRRLTGGGAILHDVELTYSIVLPSTHPLAAHRDELYQGVHGALIEALGQLGITANAIEARSGHHVPMVGADMHDPTSLALRASMAVTQDAPKVAADKIETARQPFLCFQRRSPGDVLIGGTKVCGSAQRRRAPGTPGHGAVLQHGSLLWRASPAAPELPGVVDIIKSTSGVCLAAVAELWLSGLGRRLGFDWQGDELDEKELCQAEALAKSRYACDDWTKNRGRAAERRQESL
jgi:lipoate-protein ligase A